MSHKLEQFSGRWGMFLAMLGMAVGTGNIWRFPRIAANNGGGSFLVAWVIFLLLWSVPLILVEFAIGKHTRYGTIGAFMRMLGRKYAWMGAWIAWCTIAIMFYYAVVAGWTIRYSLAAVTGELARGDVPGTLWNAFAWSPSAIIYQAIAFGFGVFVVARGVRGIEMATRILMPSLILLVLILAIRAVTLPGAVDGLNFLFTPNWSDLATPKVWLEALTQNAWDTGAGWGLILTYAIYMRPREDTTLNAFMLGFGNNTVSLLGGIMVLCTVFAVLPELATSLAANPEALAGYPGLQQALASGQALTPDVIRQSITGAGNEGLTFIWVPQLFARMPGGAFFQVLFFVALFFAAWTSLISMIELTTRVLVDTGIARKKAIAIVGVSGFVLGIPSALNQSFFGNQDFVWGVGLMVSGLFFAIVVLKTGVTKFRETYVNGPDCDIRIGAWWDWAIRLVVVEAVVLIGWWFYNVRSEPLLGASGIGNMVLQFAIAIGILLLLNNALANRTNIEEDRSFPREGQPITTIP
jgi:NSS family neurotransmitter:Na+ symporter